MSDKKKQAARRRLLKGMALGGGAYTSSKFLPDRWAEPVVDSIVTPAHAEVSGGEQNLTSFVFDESESREA